MSIHRVAEVAGVSHTTVSRVINEHPAVSPETVAKVRAAMERIHYTPPFRRRGPRSKSKPGIRSHNIGLLIDQQLGATGTIISQVLSGVETALSRRQLRLMVSHIGDGGSVPLIIRDESVDGLLMYGSIRNESLARILRKYPTVWLMSRVGHGDMWGDRALPDGQGIGLLAADYLLQRQRQRIAVIASFPSNPIVRTRLESFRCMMNQRRVHLHEFSRDVDPSTPHHARSEDDLVAQLTEEMISSGERFDGLFVVSDKLIPQVYRTLMQHGIRPMQDIDIISCNNDPLLRGITPRPATIDLRPDYIGECAVEHLLLRFDRPLQHARTEIKVAPRLVLPNETEPSDDAAHRETAWAATV